MNWRESCGILVITKQNYWRCWFFDKKIISHDEIKKLICDVQSWDLCDHLCKNLIIKLKSYDEFISNWMTSTHIYKKRAAFTLIASSVVHNKTITNDTLDDYLHIIQEYSDSEHEHVRKAISWALREIGKKDFTYNEKAILLAHELKESGNKNKMWIAKDALKELETLVKVEGRGRLISSNSKMGRE
ncbi:DNA alkylation repair protein [Jutongia sp.]